MSDRQAVAAHDADGQLWWFPTAEARHWQATTLCGGDLFCAAGRWVLLDSVAGLYGTPGRIIDDESALSWLLANGHAPPPELVGVAARHKLR